MENQEIVLRVTERISPKDIVFIIRYGNRKGRDIDLLAVVENSIETRPYQVAQFDISEMRERDYKRKLKLLDPIVTEPVLTGSLLLGNKERFTKIRKDLLKTHPIEEGIEFLKRRAFEELNNTAYFICLYEHQKVKIYLLFALIDLSFACSFHEWANYYKNHPNAFPITLSALLSEITRPLLKDVIKILKTAKAGCLICKEQVIDLFQRARLEIMTF